MPPERTSIFKFSIRREVLVPPTIVLLFVWNGAVLVAPCFAIWKWSFPSSLSISAWRERWLLSYNRFSTTITLDIFQTSRLLRALSSYLSNNHHPKPYTDVTYEHVESQGEDDQRALRNLRLIANRRWHLSSPYATSPASISLRLRLVIVQIDFQISHFVFGQCINILPATSAGWSLIPGTPCTFSITSGVVEKREVKILPVKSLRVGFKTYCYSENKSTGNKIFLWLTTYVRSVHRQRPVNPRQIKIHTKNSIITP